MSSLSDEDIRKLVEAQVIISQSLVGINATLSKVNDQNILHQERTTSDHQAIVDGMKDMMKRYWWIILLLTAALIALAGAEKILKFIPIGK